MFYGAGSKDNLKSLAKPVGGIAAATVVLQFFAGNSSLLVIALGICACGLVFAKYLSE